jgi:hypothetical protein
MERNARLSPAERIDEGLAAMKLARAMMRAGIRGRHPSYGDQQVEEEMARLLWGDELYRRVRERQGGRRP